MLGLDSANASYDPEGRLLEMARHSNCDAVDGKAGSMPGICTSFTQLRMRCCFSTIRGRVGWRGTLKTKRIVLLTVSAPLGSNIAKGPRRLTMEFWHTRLPRRLNAFPFYYLLDLDSTNEHPQLLYGDLETESIY